MALSAETLKALIVTELTAAGFVTQGQYARSEQLATALARAIVGHIQQAAEVPVSGGSSSGNYSVK
tara:strand:+ start:2823 stop:3020 length:198 start_codon:yes stop_codon:yes gene_type:complete